MAEVLTLTTSENGIEQKSVDLSDENQNQIEKYDHFGFSISSSQAIHNQVNTKEFRTRSMKEDERSKKWIKMFQKWDKFIGTKKFQERIRKGIPDAVRGRAWIQIANAHIKKKDNPDLYNELVQREAKTLEERDMLETIERDLRRTFPQHLLFSESSGQKGLENVLKAYGFSDPEVGYCQGMAFITAMFLTYMLEEDAFWVLTYIMQSEKLKMRELYLPGMPKAKQSLFVYDGLLRIHLPKIHQYFLANFIDPSMYAVQWILTIFSNTFSFDLVTRVWDVFIFEGWKIFYRICLTLVKENAAFFLQSDFEHALEFFRKLPKEIDGNHIFESCWAIKLKSIQIKTLEKLYQQQQQQLESTQLSNLPKAPIERMIKDDSNILIDNSNSNSISEVIQQSEETTFGNNTNEMSTIEENTTDSPINNNNNNNNDIYNDDDDNNIEVNVTEEDDDNNIEVNVTEEDDNKLANSINDISNS